jgi:O-antigen/teichoic acid export membrane protein
LRKDFATTFITEGLVVASYLLGFRLVAAQLGTTGFGEYALARRTLAVLVPLAALSLDTAVARYVAYAVAGNSKETARYVPAAMGLVLGAAALLSAVLLLFPGPLAALFFGSDRYADLIRPMALLLLGGGLHGIAYGHLRGRSQIQRANLLMALNQALVPLAAIVLAGGSVARILLLMGAGWTLGALLFLAFSPMDFGSLRARVVELARYGVPRLPGDLLRLTLFALPSLIVAHLADITVAGGVAFGLAAVGMLGTAMTPIGFVMLPNAARMMATGSIPELRRQVVQISRFVAIALVLGIAVVEVLATPIVTLYLGPKFAGTAETLRVIAPAALPWGIYMSLASVIDAHHVKPVNARNMAIAFAVFVVLAAVALFAAAGALAVAGAFVVSLYVLGGLTLFEVNSVTSTAREPVSLPVESELML